MKNSKGIRSILSLTAILLAINCSVPKNTLSLVEIPPASYRGQPQDTVNLGIAPWRHIFGDSALNRLIDTALLRNHDLRLALEQVKMAHAYLRMGRGAMNPQANLQGSTAFKRTAPANNQNDFGLQLNTSWEIDLWGKLSNNRKAAVAKWMVSKSGKQLIQSSLVSAVATGYIELISLDVEKGIIEKNIRLQKAALDIVQAQKLAGKSTDLAVQQFEAQYSSTKAQLANVEQQIVSAEGYLNILLNRMPQRIQRGKQLFEYEGPKEIRVGIPAQLLNNRPDILQASQALEAAGFELKSAIREFLPSLRLEGVIGYSGMRSPDLLNPTQWVSDFLAGFSAPLINQNRLKGNYILRKSARDQALITYSYTLRRAVNEVQTVLDKLALLEIEIQNRQREVKALELAIRSANDLYAYGYANYLEVINAQQHARDGELNYANAYKTRLNLYVDLYKALGGGWN